MTFGKYLTPSGIDVLVSVRVDPAVTADCDLLRDKTEGWEAI